MYNNERVFVLNDAQIQIHKKMFKDKTIKQQKAIKLT